LPSASHRLVLELSRAHKEGKAATIGDPSRVGKRGWWLGSGTFDKWF